MNARLTSTQLWLLFAALILLLRSTQHAFNMTLPDPTIALMFVGGIWIRRWPGLAGLMLAVFASDWIATGTLGVPDYCLTPAYVGLFPTYLAVWSAGWWLRSKWPHPPLLATLGTALIASTAAFVISNAFWYAFSGMFDGWPVARFAASVARYYPVYAGTVIGYVALACVIRQVVLRTRLLLTSPGAL